MSALQREIIDAFGRVRISDPKTLFDISHLYDKQPLLINEKLVGGATSVHNYQDSCVDMSVFTTGDQVIRQSKIYVPYQPGKSFLVYFTLQGIGNLTTPGLISKAGLFDDAADKTAGYDVIGDGVFWERNNDTGETYFVRRSSSVGDEERVNITKGNQPYTSTMNKYFFDTANIIFFDLEWLGVGDIACGIVADRVLHYVHIFKNTNRYPSVYMKRAALPIRYEIKSTGGAGTMKQICSTVISEGGYTPSGKAYPTKNSVLKAVTGEDIPLLAIRAKKEYNRVILNPLSLSAMCTTSGFVILRTYIGKPNCLDPGTVPMRTVHPNVSAEYLHADDLANAGIAFFASDFNDTNYYTIIGRENPIANNSSSFVSDFLNTILPGANISGEPEWIIITGTKTSQNEDIWVSLSAQEWN